MAFYHRYRPQRFQDLELTQGVVALNLVNALLKQSIGHAYLFTGTHGTGKTSTARILAKSVNCIKYSDLSMPKKTDNEALLKACVVPCNECENCISITKGNSLDVIEMDAASNRGIDEIRELKEKVRLSPVLGAKKVYIIDEVHMLTNEAFNALLKTLEEPPEHVVFVLCTTELQKVPKTILSRCVHIGFKKPGIKELTVYLKLIVEKEKIEIDEKQLDSIARMSGGAFRDAAKLLEQFSLNANMPMSGLENAFEGLFRFLQAKNLKEAINYFDNAQSRGEDFAYIIKEMIAYARSFLLVQAGVEQELPVYMQRFPKEFSANFLVDLIDQLMKALGQQKSTPVPSLPLELVYFKILGGVSPAPVVKAAAAEKPKERVVEVKKEVVEVKEEIEVVLEEPRVIEVMENPTLELMQSKWSEVVRLVKKYNASMAVLMSKCKVIGFENKSLTVETQTSFQRDMLENPKKRPIVEQAVYELTGLQVRVKCEVGKTKLTQKNVENVKEVVDEDLAAAALEIFGA
jgi:DNA polymerase III subunit gamma/tau